ncbi:unnamed protein product [Rotaria sp. Silwood2]|nr:unnamed protein product [Rotaria sp. Silwood2]CAF4192004.1 unnamed protein product [Rotaria sp. Silwood2]
MPEKNMTSEYIDNSTDDLVIIWLDRNIEKNRANQHTKELLRRLVRGHLLTFDDPDKCIDDITDETTTRRVFLIVSNFFGQNIIPLVHVLPCIQGIYIYCGDKKNAEAWTQPYSKISGIFTRSPALLDKIGNDVSMYDKNEDLPMSIFHITERENSLQQLTKESATFMWYRSILTVLRLMAKYGNSKSEMLEECRASYHDNEIEKNKINEFEQNYCAKQAISRYTQDSFVCRLLNKALRTQNIDIIFKFRLFINDLHNQIEQLYHEYLKNHSSTIDDHHLRVYRGQLLSITELDLLKRSEKELISMNSFLSTTLNQQLAKFFLGANDQLHEPSPLQSVLFIIDIYNMNKEMTPFAILEKSSCSNDTGEQEVLFSIGAIFKIQSVQQQGSIWHVHLQLSKEQNELSQSLSNHMMKQIGSEPDPLSFGWFLFRMSEYDKAQRYVEYILKQLPPDDKGIGNAYNLLGLINNDTHHHEQSVEFYEKALNIYSQLNCHDSLQVIVTHYNLGLAYVDLGETRNAEEQQMKAEEKLLNSVHSKNSLLITAIKGLKSKIQAEYGDDENALKNLQLILKDKMQRLPSNHSSIASTLNALGIIFEKMKKNIEALEHFTKALEIGQKGLTSNHKDLGEYHTNIARIYDKQKQFKSALQQYELALEIMENYREEECEKINILNTNIIEMRKKIR